MKAPSMPFYGRDIRDSSFFRMLPREMKWDYVSLLWDQWQDHGLPKDPEDLRLLTGLAPDEWAETWKRLEEKFPIDKDGKRRNTRLEEHRAEQREYLEGKRAGGRNRAADASRNGGKFTSSPPADSPAEQPAGSPAEAPAENQPASASASASAVDSSSASAGRVKGTAPAARARFAPPTLAELSEHLRARGSPVDPEAFLAHYDSQGWMVGKRPMTNWKAAVVTWEKNGLNRASRTANGKMTAQQLGAFIQQQEERDGKR